MPIKFRRGLSADRTSIIPESGEPIWTTDTNSFYIGNGSTPGGILVAASGDVTGPSSATDGHIALFDTTTGKKIKDGGKGLNEITSATSPLSAAYLSGTTTLSISQANATTSGYLSSADWNAFNSKLSTAVTSISFSGTGLTPATSTSGSVSVSGTLNVPHGGTGATTLTGVVIGTGTTSMITAYITGSTESQILKTDAAGTTYSFVDFKASPLFNDTDAGLVPAATSGSSANLFLASDRTWRKIDTAAIANQSGKTLIANTNSTTGAVSAIPISNITTDLSTVVGDNGSGGTKGIVPTPPAGAAAAGKVLSATGTFAVPTHYDGGSRI